jgi:hypothetical protein
VQEQVKNFLKDKRTKIAIAFVAVILLLIAGHYFIIFQIHQQEKASAVSLQNKCATEAKKVSDSIQGAVNSINYTYKNHYSFNLGKCYVLIHGIGVAGTGTSDKLIDAYAGTNIADCESYTTAPELNFCNFNGSNSLYNINAFNDFVGPYMQTN